MPKKFQKKVENFICDSCGLEVEGDGYTNHCPECFYSKHVDINPGDRGEKCKGLMRPILYEIEERIEYLIHECTVCKHQKRNKVSKKDNYNNLLNLVKRLNEGK